MAARLKLAKKARPTKKKARLTMLNGPRVRRSEILEPTGKLELAGLVIFWMTSDAFICV